MNATGYLVAVLALVAAAYFGQKFWARNEQNVYRNKLLRTMETYNEIQEHAKEFNNKEIIKVNENIYVAIGYALANSIMLVCPEGVVIFDVTESYEAATEIAEEFRKITDKPITDIVYSHNHLDHISGTKAFVRDEKNPPNIWAHATIAKGLADIAQGASVAYFRRAMRQFGVFLPQLSAGIGHELKFGKKDQAKSSLYPNRFVDQPVTAVTLAGANMQIVHIPGETDDQIGIWWEEHQAFLCADDLYKAFPNLYAIRGTTNRSLKQWVKSLDIILDYEPNLLVPSHGRPIIGRDNIGTLMVEYRDAIQYVHDQTIRLINNGYYPDEITRILAIPEHLAKNPYLQEFYGTVAWSSKSVFAEYMGWFSGDPVELNPLTRGEKAERMATMVGVDKMLQTAREALKSGDFQWALELSTYVADQAPADADARDIRVEALTALGSRQLSVNGRNYYLTSALEAATELKLPPPTVEAKAQAFEMRPFEMSFEAMSVFFNPEECNVKNQTLYLKLSEPDSDHYIQIRNSVAIIKHKIPTAWDLKVKTTEDVWKQVMVGKKSAIVAAATGEIEKEGGALAIKTFFDCFDREVGAADYRI